MQLTLIIWVCVIVEDRGSYVEGQKSRVENSKFLSILKVLQPFWKLPNAAKQLVLLSKLKDFAYGYNLCILKGSLVELKVWCEVWFFKVYVFYYTLEFKIYKHGRWSEAMIQNLHFALMRNLIIRGCLYGPAYPDSMKCDSTIKYSIFSNHRRFYSNFTLSRKTKRNLIMS
jgi:hypothetical protein